MPRIVVVGSYNTDLTSYVERMPRPGETISGRRFVTGPGGKGSNQAVAAARLGADVTFVGRIGQDVFAESALKMWSREGINTDFVVQDLDNATGVAPIIVDDAGENMIVVALGANLAMTQADIDCAANIIAQADIVLTQLEINPEITAYALKVAKDRGVRTILNPAPAIALPQDVIALADYITPNETELETLSGSHSDVQSSARSLLVRDDQTVIVTMGSQGARYVRREDSKLVGTFDVDVVDTTGAGDAFNGGLAVALAEGLDLEAAIAFANATAALCVTKPGTSASMPTRAEVDQFIKSRS